MHSESLAFILGQNLVCALPEKKQSPGHSKAV